MKTRGSRPDPGISAASNSNRNTSSNLHRLRTKPNCARCRNHKEITPVKGHKRFCPNRNCSCFKCYVVTEGGKYRALQLRNWREDEKELRETDRDTSSETDSDKFRETAIPTAPGTDSRTVTKSDALLSLCGYYSARNPFTSNAPNAIHNIIPPPQLQHRLTRWCHQDFERYTPLNTADTIVEERTESPPSSISLSEKTQPIVNGDLQNYHFSKIPPQQISYRPQSSSKTQPSEPTAWMTNHSFTVPLPQSIPRGERFTNTGPMTTVALVTDMCSIKSGSDSLTPSGSSGRTSPIYPGTYTNIATSIIEPLQQNLQFPPAGCHSSTNYPSQAQVATPTTDLLSMIGGSGSVSSSSTTKTTVPNVPNVCMHAVGGKIPPHNTKAQNRFATYRPRNIVNFHSIDSLSSSSTSKIRGAPPIMPSAWTNVSRTSVPAQLPVMRPSECSCGNLPSYGAPDASYYDTLIGQMDLNYLFLNIS